MLLHPCAIIRSGTSAFGQTSKLHGTSLMFKYLSTIKRSIIEIERFDSFVLPLMSNILKEVELRMKTGKINKLQYDISTDCNCVNSMFSGIPDDLEGVLYNSYETFEVLSNSDNEEIRAVSNELLSYLNSCIQY